MIHLSAAVAGSVWAAAAAATSLQRCGCDRLTADDICVHYVTTVTLGGCVRNTNSDVIFSMQMCGMQVRKLPDGKLNSPEC